jgi:hypothetical protein
MTNGVHLYDKCHTQSTHVAIFGRGRRFFVPIATKSPIAETSQSRSQKTPDTGTVNTVPETVRNPPTADSLTMSIEKLSSGFPWGERDQVSCRDATDVGRGYRTVINR